MHIVRPPSHRIREVLGIVVLALLAVVAGLCIQSYVGPQSRWLAISVATVFLGVAIGVVNAVTRRG